MSGDTSLINLGELSKPATVLIEKISEAIGGIFKLYQIRRIVKAEAEAEKIRAVAQIEITELQQRAMARFFTEEARKQANMECITRKAIPHINDDARPQELEDDWISNFFDKCRLISDGEMQSLWAKILAGEANTTGKYSKRTVNFLSSIDKSDAQLFTQLCGFGWFLEDVVLFIYDVENEIYKKHGITFKALKHLDEIGLLTFQSLTGFGIADLPQIVKIHYHGTHINIMFSRTANNNLPVGQVILSKVGQELAQISGSKPVHDFMNFVLSKWISEGLAVYSDWPKQNMHRTH